MASIDKDGDTILQGTLSVNGALTTIGDAVGDALTFNAGTWTGNQVITFTLKDAVASALSFGATDAADMLKFVTTNGAEGITMSKDLAVEGATTIGNAAADTLTFNAGAWTGAEAVTFTVKDDVASGLSIGAADAAHLLKFVTTNGAEGISMSKTLTVEGATTINQMPTADTPALKITAAATPVSTQNLVALGSNGGAVGDMLKVGETGVVTLNIGTSGGIADVPITITGKAASTATQVLVNVLGTRVQT